jgi:hypothetical protein
LLHGLRQFTFALQRLKTPVLLVQNGLLGVEYQTIQ